MKETFDFSSPILKQGDIEAFAASKVNLSKSKYDDYVYKLGKVRSYLETYLEEHPDELGIEKIRLTGSLAKGTSLKTINDLDMAVYVKGDVAPDALPELLEWLAKKLRKTFHQLPQGNITVDEPCVAISYEGIDLKIEVMPVVHTGKSDDSGYIWDRVTRKKVLTNIPLQIEVVRSRKQKTSHFCQVIRLLKWWSKQKQLKDAGLRSFMIEIIAAHVLDSGVDFMDYHKGLIGTFSKIKNDKLKKRIVLTDYYGTGQLPSTNTGLVEIFDPVNPNNNLTSNMTESDRQKIVSAAEEAHDELVYACSVQTKQDAIECWQNVMGAGFTA